MICSIVGFIFYINANIGRLKNLSVFVSVKVHTATFVGSPRQEWNPRFSSNVR